MKKEVPVAIAAAGTFSSDTLRDIQVLLAHVIA